MGEIKKTRIALYGYWSHFRSAYDITDAWFSKLFDEFTLFPYFDFEREEVKNLLFKKPILSRLVPVFSKRLRITSLLNDFIGTDIFNSNKKGFIEEIAEILVDEIESRTTLDKRITNTENKRDYYAGISYPFIHTGYEKLLQDSHSLADGDLICIDGHLIHLDALKETNDALYESLQPTGLQWFISDFPYFQMIPGNPKYNGSIAGLRFSNELNELIGRNVPFKSTCGWYPYVRLFGVLRSSHSPKYSSLKVIDYCWMYFRAPKSFDAIHHIIENDFSASPESYCWQDLTLNEIQLLLSAIQISYSANSLSYEKAGKEIRNLVEIAISKVNKSDISAPIRSFYA